MSKAESLTGFIFGFWRKSGFLILRALLLTLTATCIRMCIPIAAHVLLSYDGKVQKNDRNASMLTTDGVKEMAGNFSERFFGPLATPILALFHREAGASLVAYWRGDDARVSPATSADALYAHGLVCRCLCAAAFVVGYHIISLLAHLSAYQASMATQSTIMQESLKAMLDTKQPERIAVIDPARLTHIVTSSAKTSADVLGSLLTDVVSSLFVATGTLFFLFFISAKLTFIIGGLVGVVQLVYLAAGRSNDRRGMEVSAHEAELTSFFTNAVQRSETIFVFECQEFIVRRLGSILASLKMSTASLNVSIHGFACLSTSSTTLVVVTALCISNYLQHIGELQFSDAALYFINLFNFVNDLSGLAMNASRTWATFGKLHNLQQTLLWFEDSATAAHTLSRELQEDEAKPLSPLVLQSDDSTSCVKLTDVSFTYPMPPEFLSPDKKADTNKTSPSGAGSAVGQRTNGIKDMSMTAEAGKITALYGPSGCGKSTTLRLLAGLVHPHMGRVNTHRRVVLLEQAHAIFMGSVAENIVLNELKSHKGKDHEKPQIVLEGGEQEVTDIRKRVELAMAQSRCSAFLADPYEARIDNVDKPPFSGGQLRRICLARVFARGSEAQSVVSTKKDNEDGAEEKKLMTGCSLVLLDEPTTGLDASTVTELLPMIKELRDVHGMTVVISTHDARVADISDTVIRLGR